MGFCLLYRGTELPIVSDTIIGRGPECAIRLRGPGVSRRHARITIDDDGATVHDMASANGVFVNDGRIHGSKRLMEGDWLTIGGHSLQLDSYDRASAWQDDEIVDEDTDTEFGMATERASQLVLTAEASLEMIKVGMVSEGEALLARRLDSALARAGSKDDLDPATRRDAARYAVELAMATAKPRWIGYVFELFNRCQAMLPSELMGVIKTAAAMLPSTVDVAPLQTYIDMLRAGHVGARPEDIEAALALLEQLRAQP